MEGHKTGALFYAIGKFSFSYSIKHLVGWILLLEHPQGCGQ